MTPSEKKAREIRRYKLMVTTFSNEAQRHSTSQLYESDQGNLVRYADHLDALDAAERRGFQRGMAEATKLMQDNLRKGLTHDEA